MCDSKPRLALLTSGSRFLKTYILVFSIMANRSGLSLAHFMSHTSLRSNLDGSPAPAWFPAASSGGEVEVEERASRSSRLSTPAMSMMARRLRRREEDVTGRRAAGVPAAGGDWLLPGVAVEGQVVRPVVEGILLDEGHVWEAVSVEASRLSALERHTNQRPMSSFGNTAPFVTLTAYNGCRRTTMRVLSVAVTQQMGSRVAWNRGNEEVWTKVGRRGWE